MLTYLLFLHTVQYTEKNNNITDTCMYRFSVYETYKNLIQVSSSHDENLVLLESLTEMKSFILPQVILFRAEGKKNSH